jgi:hypothetical protein
MMDLPKSMFTSIALSLENPVRAEEATKLVSREGKMKDLRSLPYEVVEGSVRFTERDWSSRVASPVSETAKTVDGIQ